MLLNFYFFSQFLSFLPASLLHQDMQKELNEELDMDFEIPAECIFYGNEKAIQWTKGTLDGADGKS